MFLTPTDSVKHQLVYTGQTDSSDHDDEVKVSPKTVN